MLAFLFPGQGSQYVGMGKELAESFPKAKAYFDQADKVLGYDLTEVCFSGPEAKLNQTIHTQPALLTVSVAAWAVLSDNGIKPDMLAGHSLGEYTALVAAGALDFGQALSLVQKRAAYMQAAVPEGQGAMAAIVGLTRDEVSNICRRFSPPDVVEAANFNCPGQVVISGSHASVLKAMEQARQWRAKLARQLPLSIPSHCSLMRTAGEKLAHELDKLELNQTAIPIISNVTAKPMTSAAEIKAALIKQVSSPVLWEDSISYMIAQGVDTFIELGPGQVLKKLLKRINKDVSALQVEDEDSLQKTLTILPEKFGSCYGEIDI